MAYEQGVGPVPYTKAKEDLTMIVAQMVSGVEGVTPEQEDYELACEIENLILDRIADWYDF